MIREDDLGTALTQNAIRTKVLAGEIPFVHVGNKRLINYDLLLDILAHPPIQTEEPTQQGIIRRVAG
jgi:hypothetical protein